MTIQLELKDYGIIVKQTDPSGIVRSKIVDAHDVARALADKVRIDTGILPRNTRFFSRTTRGFDVFVELPEHTRRIEYSHITEEFIVPMPYTCFIMRCTEDDNEIRISEVFLFVLHGPILSTSTMLYRFPFGNVFSGGSVCMGSVPYPTVEATADLSVIPELILSSKFNGDLSIGNFTTFVDPDSNLDIFRSEHLAQYLKGKKAFPYDILIAEGRIENYIR